MDKGEGDGGGDDVIPHRTARLCNHGALPDGEAPFFLYRDSIQNRKVLK